MTMVRKLAGYFQPVRTACFHVANLVLALDRLFVGCAGLRMAAHGPQGVTVDLALSTSYLSCGFSKLRSRIFIDIRHVHSCLTSHAFGRIGTQEAERLWHPKSLWCGLRTLVLTERIGKYPWDWGPEKGSLIDFQ